MVVAIEGFVLLLPNASSAFGGVTASMYWN